MSRILEHSWLFATLLALTIAGAVLYQTGRLGPVQRALSDLSSPIGEPSNALAARAVSAIDAVRRFQSLESENTDLRAEVERLALENVRLTELANENGRLRDELGYKQTNPSLQLRGAEIVSRGGGGLVPGRVTSRDPSPYLSVLTINLGQRDGVKPGQAVVTPLGLLGRIVDVGERTARVLLLTDRASSVNGQVMRTRVTGVVQGTGDGRLLMRYIEQGGDIKVGDIVLTAGLGGVFPRGQPIGQVTSVRQQDIELFQEAEIRPTVDFSRLENVLVVTQFEPTPPENP